MISIWSLILLLLTFIIYKLYKKSNVDSIPGPKGIPILGNLLQLEKRQNVPFTNWARKFGSIYKVNFAGTKSIVISDHALLKDIFADERFSGRMDVSLFDWVQNGKLHGIMNTDGKHWEELRRFTLRHLRDFGFSKSSMENLIMIEVSQFLDGLAEQNGKAVANVRERLLLAVVNSLWSIVTGQRHDQNDPELLQMTWKAHKTFEAINANGAVLIFVPILAKIFPKWSGYTRIKANMLEFLKYFRNSVKEHKSSYNEDYQRDFVDAFLKKIKRTSGSSGSAFSGKFGEDNLVATMSDFYFAGSDTTSTTLAWLTLILGKYPKVQAKLQKEIGEITGNSRSCSLSDRSRMPFAEAVISETLRFSSILPLGVHHRTLQDVVVKGHKIPKDTSIIPNLHYIHHNPNIWENSGVFIPERFLTAEGLFKKHDALMPFSIGKRQCLGESLARDSLFLFATNIFQRFDVKLETDSGLEPLMDGFLLVPKPFSALFTERTP